MGKWGRRRARQMRRMIDAELDGLDHSLEERAAELGETSLVSQALDSATERQDGTRQSVRARQLAEFRAARGIAGFDNGGGERPS